MSDSVDGPFKRHIDIFYEEKDDPERITLHGFVINTQSINQNFLTMKIKFMITAAIAALALVGGYLGKAAINQADGLSDLELANAEALADPNEGGSSESWPCWSELKDGKGEAWRCGNPCKLESGKLSSKGQGTCYSN